MKQSIGHQQQQKKSVLYLVFSVRDFWNCFLNFCCQRKRKKLQNSLWKSCDPIRYFCLAILNKIKTIYLSQSLISCISVLYGEGRKGVFEKLMPRWHGNLAKNVDVLWVTTYFFHLNIIFNILSRSKMHPCTISICTWKVFPVLASRFAFKKPGREL